MVQCFDTSGNLKLVEEVAVLQSVQQLCLSPSCTKLAVGAADGAILTANSSKLSSSLKCVSNHLHTELIGLAVLCPGTEHCVVSTMEFEESMCEI